MGNGRRRRLRIHAWGGGGRLRRCGCGLRPRLRWARQGRRCGSHAFGFRRGLARLLRRGLGRLHRSAGGCLRGGHGCRSWLRRRSVPGGWTRRLLRRGRAAMRIPPPSAAGSTEDHHHEQCGDQAFAAAFRSRWTRRRAELRGRGHYGNRGRRHRRPDRRGRRWSGRGRCRGRCNGGPAFPAERFVGLQGSPALPANRSARGGLGLRRRGRRQGQSTLPTERGPRPQGRIAPLASHRHSPQNLTRALKCKTTISESRKG